MTVCSSLLSGPPLLAPPAPECWTNTTTGQSIPVSSMSSVEWVNSEEKPHLQPLPRAGFGRRVWKSKLARYPRPNPDLLPPQLPNLQHQAKRMLTRLPLQPADKVPVSRLQRDQEFSFPGFPGRDFAKSRDPGIFRDGISLKFYQKKYGFSHDFLLSSQIWSNSYILEDSFACVIVKSNLGLLRDMGF